MLSKNKKKRQEAEAAEREHAMNRPADYESANKDAMDKLVQAVSYTHLTLPTILLV